MPGVLHFDVARVATTMKLFESGALVAEPEYTIYAVASAESPD